MKATRRPSIAASRAGCVRLRAGGAACAASRPIRQSMTAAGLPRQGQNRGTRAYPAWARRVESARTSAPGWGRRDGCEHGLRHSPAFGAFAGICAMLLPAPVGAERNCRVSGSTRAAKAGLIDFGDLRPALAAPDLRDTGPAQLALRHPPAKIAIEPRASGQQADGAGPPRGQSSVEGRRPDDPDPVQVVPRQGDPAQFRPHLVAERAFADFAEGDVHAASVEECPEQPVPAIGSRSPRLDHERTADGEARSLRAP